MSDYVKRSSVVEYLKSIPPGVFGFIATSSVGDPNVIPSEDVAPFKRGIWIVSHEHLWEKNEFGEPDMEWWCEDYHEGVSCRMCHENVCVHCEPDWKSLPCTVGHYVCSECGAREEREYPFCHCGARMTSEHLVNHLNLNLKER